MSAKRRIALVTSSGVDVAETNDESLRFALVALGSDVEWCAWDSPSVDWDEFDAVVIRCCWDYHLRHGEFSRWIRWLDTRRIPLFNPSEILLWNMDKAYLLDLEHAGVPVPPTVVATHGDDAALTLEATRDRFRTDALVIKPTVSASAYWTWRTKDVGYEESTRRLDWLLMRGGAVLQAYVPEIEEAGELSLIYCGDTLLHAVRKVPRRGDFRTQPALGAAVGAVDASKLARACAESALEFLSKPPLYARVDVVETAAGAVLMELELVEPNLFFDNCPGSAMRIADSLLRQRTRAASSVNTLRA